jgi:hypothetical protein
MLCSGEINCNWTFEDGIRAVEMALRPIEMHTITADASTDSAKAADSAAPAACLGCRREQARSQRGRCQNSYRLSHGFLLSMSQVVGVTQKIA